MNLFRTNRIRELLFQLRTGYEWCQKSKRNQARRFDLYERSLPIVKELVTLGVSSSFSASLFFFGFELTDEILKQFEPKSYSKPFLPSNQVEVQNGR